MDPLLTTLVPFLVGYAFGSIPSGLLLSRALGLGDVRATGSGNIGATNALRHGGRKLGAATLVCDLLKGTLGAIFGFAITSMLAGVEPGLAFASAFGRSYSYVLLLAGMGAFLGHLYPVWLGFRGGKGVATFIGVLLAWAWPLALVFAAAWLAVAATGRISSLAALCASVIVAVAAWFIGPLPLAIAVTTLVGLVFLRHRDNIARLRKGEEPRIGKKR
ncbi:MAG: glycerol-3-phosphate 1-O-acyltransferase PlsY [Pseudomonadota bacterium]